MSLNSEKEWFGNRPVTPDEKTGLVRGVFDNVAVKYDLMNDLMSGGMHRLWKNRLVRMIRPRAGLRYLDVAGGTGDVAFRIKNRISESRNLGISRNSSEIPRFRDSCTPITICDLTPHMLDVGRDRAADRGWADDFEWVTGNAESLPFPDESFDVYTIAFGLRNVTHIDRALAEAARILKPGGRFFCLEFSRVQWPILDKIYDVYSDSLIPKIGRAVTRDEASYRYLVESIRKFPHQKALARRIEAAGLKNARFTDLSGGIVAIHQALRA